MFPSKQMIQEPLNISRLRLAQMAPALRLVHALGGPGLCHIGVVLSAAIEP